MMKLSSTQEFALRTFYNAYRQADTDQPDSALSKYDAGIARATLDILIEKGLVAPTAKTWRYRLTDTGLAEAEARFVALAWLQFVDVLEAYIQQEESLQRAGQNEIFQERYAKHMALESLDVATNYARFTSGVRVVQGVLNVTFQGGNEQEIDRLVEDIRDAQLLIYLFDHWRLDPVSEPLRVWHHAEFAECIVDLEFPVRSPGEAALVLEVLKASDLKNPDCILNANGLIQVESDETFEWHQSETGSDIHEYTAEIRPKGNDDEY